MSAVPPSDDGAARRRRLQALGLAWFALSVAASVDPLHGILGNRVEPRVFGIPFSLVYPLVLIVGNTLVLALLYRARVAAGEELDADAPRGAQR